MYFGRMLAKNLKQTPINGTLIESQRKHSDIIELQTAINTKTKLEHEGGSEVCETVNWWDE